MSDLISNVLDLTRLESGQVALRRDWETLDDLAALRAAPRRGTRLARTIRSIDLAPDLPAVHVDAALVVQVFANLFDNVLKYTPAGTRARVSAAADGPFVRVSVDDDGPGFPPGDPERLFDKFQRGADEPATVGVGLGLAICRAIVEAHGGEIHARAPSRSAARASSSRCRRRSPALDRGDAPGPGRGGRAGHPRSPARAAGSGKAIAWSRRTPRRARTVEARTHKPDLLVVDLGLPDRDGLDVIRGVRAWSPVPIVVLSARTMEEQKIAALDAGADDYVTKPFGAPETAGAHPRGAAPQRADGDAGAAAQARRGRNRPRAQRRASGPGGEIHLTPLEYRVLECLARQPGLS